MEVKNKWLLPEQGRERQRCVVLGPVLCQGTCRVFQAGTALPQGSHNPLLAHIASWLLRHGLREAFYLVKLRKLLMSPALGKGMFPEAAFSSVLARAPRGERHAGSPINVSSPCRLPFTVLPGAWWAYKRVLTLLQECGLSDTFRCAKINRSPSTYEQAGLPATRRGSLNGSHW